ncbi:7-cyano-7-deazaguanine synthase [Candidatus Saccharibacteria bacterium]|jgi:7-cyano-7-deazaguanine synthase in queuosine biosynthesis|nr:7-cyano-7-deazaguanine synthase [Candidatus Saccharibacteria bacterium]
MHILDNTGYGKRLMTQSKLYKEQNKTNRTLVMFSGGLDSTAALWHVLNRPKKYGEIHVHHIHIQNVENRWQAEAAAVKAILAYMRKNAPAEFTTSESTIRTPQLGNKFMFDAEIFNYLSGYMTSRDPLINKVVIGITGTDYKIGFTEIAKRGKAMHNAFHLDEEDNATRIKEFPHKDLTKDEVYKTLPPELALLTWSCRRPRYVDGKPIECGKCKTCVIAMRDVKRPKPPNAGFK